jgi:putative MFS transporter
MSQVQLSISQRMDRLPLSAFHWRMARSLGVCMLIAALSMEVFPLALIMMKQEWKLTVSQLSWILTLAQAFIMVITLNLGFFSREFGRKSILIWSLVFLCIGNLLIATAYGPLSLAFARIVQVAGFTALMIMANTLVVELSPMKNRGQVFSAAQFFLPLGDAIGVAIGFYLIPIIGWRSIFLFTSLAAVYGFFLYRRVPESPRGLESLGEHANADQEMRKIEAQFELDSPPPPETSAPRPLNSSMSNGKWSDLWKNGYAKRTFAFSLMSFVNQYLLLIVAIWLPMILVSFGYSIQEAFKLVLYFTIAASPALFVSAFFIDRIGRKATLGIYIILCLAACLGFVFLDSKSIYVIVFGCLMRFAFAGYRAALQGFAAESYPTHLRTLGTSWSMGWAGLGGTLCPVFVGLILSSYPSRHDVFFLHVAGLLLLAVVVLAVFGRETKGVSLE